jgi:transcriptional regulator with XRE-family HTH domain
LLSLPTSLPAPHLALSDRLRQARKRAGMTQAQAAQALGQRQNFISRSENGRRKIDPIELADFMELYDTTFDELIPASTRKFRKVAEPLVPPRQRRRKPRS